MCADFSMPAGGGDMWVDEQFTRPLGVPVAAGSAPSGEGTTNSGPVAAPDDLQAKLFALVSELRRQQPHELAFLDHPELRRLRADLNHLTVIVEMAAQVAMTAAERSEQMEREVDDLWKALNRMEAA